MFGLDPSQLEFLKQCSNDEVSFNKILDFIAVLQRDYSAQVHNFTSDVLKLELDYRAVVESQPDMVCRYNTDFILTFVNKAYCHYYDKKRDELIGHSLLDIVPSSAKEFLTSKINMLMLSKHYQISEVRENNPRWGDHWIEWTDYPVLNDDGEVIEVQATGRDITRMKQTEEILRESENRYRILSELMTDYAFSFIVNSDGTQDVEWITEDAFARITGYSAEDIRGTLNLYHPDERERVQQHLTDLLTGVATDYEYRIVTKKGEERWIQLSRRPIWDKDQKRVVRFYGVAKEITERKRAEAELRRSEERYRVISELTSDYTYSSIIMADGRIIADWITEAAFKKITGYSLAEIQESNRLFHPEEHEKVAQHMQLLKEGYSVNSDYRIITKSGEHRWLNISRFAIWDENEERFNRFVGVAKDITEQKIAAEILRQNDERYRLLVRNLPKMAVMLFDHNLRFLLAEGELLIKNGYVPEKMEGHTVYDILPPAALSQLEPYYRAAIEGKEVTLEYSHGISIFESHFFPINTDGSIITGMLVIYDITEKKKSEQQAIELSVQTERIRLLANFITNASHEFRTPLSIINSSLHLAERSDSVERKHFHFEKIRNQVKLITSLVDSLVMMSRLDVEPIVAYEEVNLNNLLFRIHTDIAPQLQKRHLKTYLILSAVPLKIHADPPNLIIALENILDNALRYTRDDGQITIHLRADDTGHYAVIEIIDTGVGISADVLPHIFERFYRVDEAHSTAGFGLGLSIAQKIIEQHHGKIIVDSILGKGTSVFVMLPLINPLELPSQL